MFSQSRGNKLSTVRDVYHVSVISGMHRNSPQTRDSSDCGQVISSCACHTLDISFTGENTDWLTLRPWPSWVQRSPHASEGPSWSFLCQLWPEGTGRAKEERKRFGGKNVGYMRVKKRSRYSTMQKSWATTDFFIFCLPGGGRFFCTFKVFQALWRSFKLCLWTLAGFHVFSPCTRPSEEFWDNLWAACHKNTFHYEKCQR